MTSPADAAAGPTRFGASQNGADDADGANGADVEDLAAYRAAAAAFLVEAIAAGEHCPAYGVIMAPALHDRARAWQRRMFDAGYAGIHWPTDYGGQGLTRAHSAIWAEECAKAEVQHMLNLQGIILAGEAILRSGTDAQKARYLEVTLSGEILWCQLFSEPEAGSDLASLRTSATRDGDAYVVNGQKVWCSNGQHAEFGILLARTDPTEVSHAGISFFLLDMASPGVDVRPLTQMTGDDEFCEGFLDDVTVPADALLGSENGGWRVAMEVLQDERGSSGAAGLISLDRRLAELAAVGGDHPVRRDELAGLLTRGHALRALLLGSMAADADSASGGSPGSHGSASAASAAKLLRTELDVDAELYEAALRGPAAMLDGEATQRLLYAPGMKIAGGSSEIQRNIIGERILGLPREPRP